jgi:catechol 2,3-dioxygenase-like lactoylglutathione lyase family enzyme
MFSEIKIVTEGVADLDRSVAFYGDAFGFDEVSRSRVDHEAMAEAWRIPAGIAGRFAVMGIPGHDSGMLRLVEWTPSGDPVRAPPARFQDLGPFALNFRARDIHDAWNRLGQAGAAEKAKPAYLDVDENIAAWDSQCADPDGTVLQVFQAVGEIERALGPFPHDHDLTEIQALTLHCADAPRAAAFYEGLGFEPLYDRIVEDLGGSFGLPQDARVHSIHLIMPGDRSTGRVNLGQCVGLPGRSLKTRTAPPARGPLMLSLQVRNLDLASARMKTLGARAIAAARYDSPPFGTVNSATFFGLDDEVIELLEVRTS